MSLKSGWWSLIKSLVRAFRFHLKFCPCKDKRAFLYPRMDTDTGDPDWAIDFLRKTKDYTGNSKLISQTWMCSHMLKSISYQIKRINNLVMFHWCLILMKVVLYSTLTIVHEPFPIEKQNQDPEKFLLLFFSNMRVSWIIDSTENRVKPLF